jgi:hypothetical protein
VSETFDLSGTSPAAAGTSPGVAVSGLARYLGLRVEAKVVGATGGTLDVYLQRKLGPDLWADWVHFPQLAAGASALLYSFTIHNVSSAAGALTATTSGGTDSTPTSTGGTGIIVNTHPGEYVRVVYVAGSGTSAGAPIKVYITGIGPS